MKRHGLEVNSGNAVPTNACAQMNISPTIVTDKSAWGSIKIRESLLCALLTPTKWPVQLITKLYFIK